MNSVDSSFFGAVTWYIWKYPLIAPNTVTKHLHFYISLSNKLLLHPNFDKIILYQKMQKHAFRIKMVIAGSCTVPFNCVLKQKRFVLTIS
jgi:hypothetical protein